MSVWTVVCEDRDTIIFESLILRAYLFEAVEWFDQLEVSHFFLSMLLGSEY